MNTVARTKYPRRLGETLLYHHASSEAIYPTVPEESAKRG